MLVNNASNSGSAEQDFYSTEAWHRIMAVNATGVFFGIKYAVPAMVANGGGSIVNLSSIAGIIGSEQVHMAHNASMAAVRLMTSADTLPSELQLLEEEYVAALVGQRPFEMGEKAMDALLALHDRKPAPQIIYTCVDRVTKDNVGEFLK